MSDWTPEEIARFTMALDRRIHELEDTVRHVLPEMEQSSDKEIRQLVPGLACLLGGEAVRDAAIARAEKAEADLKAYLADTAVTCAYCEARHERPVTFEDIRAHVVVCPKHPLAAALAQVKQLREALEHCRQRPHEHNPGPDFTITRCEVIDRALAATEPKP